MRRLSIGLMIPIVTLTLLLLLIRWVGGTKAIPLAEIIGPDPTCPQPCWHGIQVNRATIDEARSILLADYKLTHMTVRPDLKMIEFSIPSPELGWAYVSHWPPPPRNIDGNEILHIRFDLTDKARFRLGDAMALWGEPLNAHIHYCGGGDALYAVVTAYFKGNIEVRTNPLFNNWGGKPAPTDIRITPDLPLVMVQYYSDYSEMLSTLPSYRGFKQWDESEFAIFGRCDI